MQVLALICAFAVALTGCRPADETPAVDDRLLVDPETTEIGAPVGLFHLADVSARQAEPGLWYGEARFEGEIELQGRYFDFQPDPNAPGPPNPCFDVDEDRDHHVPRFPGDERRTWFCFTNPSEAVRELGEPTAEGRLLSTIITDYRYVFEPTDVVNRATFSADLHRERGHILPEHPPELEPDPPPAR